MASILNVFEPKTKILSAEVNENFELVQADVAEMGRALNTFIEGELTSLQSNLSSAQATLQNNINTISSKLSNIYDDIAPNYGAGYSVSSGWTAPKAGWVAWQTGTLGRESTTVLVDGITVEGAYMDGSHQIYGLTPIATGSTFTTLGGALAYATFYPCKGV